MCRAREIRIREINGGVETKSQANAIKIKGDRERGGSMGEEEMKRGRLGDPGVPLQQPFNKSPRLSFCKPSRI